jgi:hypothetical protein
MDTTDEVLTLQQVAKIWPPQTQWFVVVGGTYRILESVVGSFRLDYVF